MQEKGNFGGLGVFTTEIDNVTKSNNLNLQDENTEEYCVKVTIKVVYTLHSCKSIMEEHGCA